MALERSLVTIPLAQGLDTKGDAKQLAPGKLTLLQNGVFTTGKKLRKRYGTSVKPTSVLGPGTIAAGDTLRSSNGEMLLRSSRELYSWSNSISRWVDKGALVGPSLTRLPAVRANGGASEVASAETGGVVCYAYIDDAGTWVVTYDRATGQTVNPVLIWSLATVQRSVRCVAFNGGFVVAVYDGSAAAILYSARDTFGAPVSSGSTFAPGGGGHFDMVATASKVFFSYSTFAGTDLCAQSLSTGYVLSAAPLFGMALAATVRVIAVGEDTTSGNIMVLSVHSPGGTDTVYLSVLSSTLTVIAAKVSVEAGVYAMETVAALDRPYPGSISTDAAGTPRCWYTVRTSAATAGTSWLVKTRNLASYAAGALTTVLRNAYLTAGSFVMDGTDYIGIMAADGYGRGRFIVNGKSGAVVARVAVEDGYLTKEFTASRVTVSGTRASFPVEVDAGLANNGIARAGVDAIDLSFAALPLMSADLGGTTLFAGALPMIYDGATVTEHGFNHSPGSISSAISVGGALPAGSYGYAATYEWTDATGAVHRSEPVFLAAPAVTSGGNLTANIAVPTLRITAKGGASAPPRIALYRTAITGSVYYFLTSKLNSSTVDSVSFIDDGTVTDLALIAKPMLYSTGGVLDNQPPPALSALTVYRNRLVGISAERPTQIWYSKQVIPGQPIEFSDLLILNLDPVGGDGTALAALDDKLLIFKPGVVYYITGSGPDTTGGQNDFSVPILINTNSGCTEPRSVITAADGCMYQSAKGWYILDRSLSDEYVGRDVEAFNALTTRSVVQTPSTNEVRFTLSDGTILVYDFHFKQWSVFTGLAAVDSTVWSGAVHTVNSSGVVSYENPAVFTDNGTAIELRLKTGWLGAGDLQSFLRIYKLLVLGQWKSSHTLNVWVGHDYRSDVAAANKYAIVATADPSPAQFQYRLNLAVQKCEAVQLTVFDSGIAGESLDLSAFTFEVGVKKGPNRMPAARSV